VGVWIAGLLAVLSLAGCSRSLADLFGLSEEPPPVEAGDTFTVTYEAGNGYGGPVVVTPDSKGEITLPGQEGFTALETEPGSEEKPMVFAGWNYETFTYKAGAKYTVTRNVTFQARWGFTSATGVAEYFVPANKDKYTVGTNILLVACDDGEDTLTKTILTGMLSKILPGSTVELDLSASTFGVVTGEVLELYNFNDFSVNKLILPCAATSTFPDSNYKYGGSAHEVSGLNVVTIGIQAFKGCTLLETADFPKAEIIGSSVFSGCSALTTANFPKATKIGTSAFYGCAALGTADFPEATDIMSSAFTSCNNLTTANFPKAKTIGDYAFERCTNLETITIGGDCTIAASPEDDPISEGFRNAYENANRKAGTYTRDPTGAWSGPTT
jgi:hypothetical protein